MVSKGEHRKPNRQKQIENNCVWHLSSSSRRKKGREAGKEGEGQRDQSQLILMFNTWG
jgi:hypothetical protein